MGGTTSIDCICIYDQFLALNASNQTAEKAAIEVYNCRLQTMIGWFSGNHSNVASFRANFDLLASDSGMHRYDYGSGMHTWPLTRFSMILRLMASKTRLLTVITILKTFGGMTTFSDEEC